jgi:dihydrofolate reductase
MRKITVLSFITLDGVIQAPGGPEEDPTEDFKYGGWSAPFDEESSGPTMQKQLERADLLLGRKTFDIFEEYWPKHADYWPGVNEVTKYVLSTTRNKSDWQNSEFLSSIEDIKNLKNSDGPEIKIWGSSKLVQLLLKHDLVDEFWLNIHPVILGKGKRLFDENSVPSSFTLADNFITKSGVILANYKRAGEVKTGNMGA